MVRALRRFWALAVVVFLATLTGLLVALLLAPKSYRSTAVVAMVPRPDVGTGGDLLRLTLPSYAYLATSDATAVDLAGRFGEDAGRIGDSISVQIPPASNTLLVSATWSDPETAARLANGLADVLRQGTAGDPLLSASPLTEALPPASPSWPPWRASLVAGCLLAVAVGVTTAVVADRRRPLVTSPAHVVALLEDEGMTAPVLLSGSVPGSAAAAVATTVEQVSADRNETGVPLVALAVVGEDAGPGVALAAGVAAELARRGHQVLLLVSERDAALLDQSSITSTLAHTRPGTVITDAGSAGSRAGGRDHLPGVADADVLVEVTDGIEPLTGPAPGRVVGVVPVVGPSALTDELQSTLRSLRKSGAPVPVVCCLLPPSAGRRARRPRVTGGPSRAGSAPSDGPLGSGRVRPSSAGTGLSS
jgi:hypothetical protein